MKYCTPQPFGMTKYNPLIILDPETLRLKKPITPDEIIDIVLPSFGVTRFDVKSHRRAGDIPDARHTCISLIIKYCPKMTLKHVGGLFGNLDHSTVIFGRDKIEDILFSDVKFKVKYNNIVSKINSVIYME